MKIIVNTKQPFTEEITLPITPEFFQTHNITPQELAETQASILTSQANSKTGLLFLEKLDSMHPTLGQVNLFAAVVDCFDYLIPNDALKVETVEKLFHAVTDKYEMHVTDSKSHETHNGRWYYSDGFYFWRTDGGEEYSDSRCVRMLEQAYSLHEKTLKALSPIKDALGARCWYESNPDGDVSLVVSSRTQTEGRYSIQTRCLLNDEEIPYSVIINRLENYDAAASFRWIYEKDKNVDPFVLADEIRFGEKRFHEDAKLLRDVLGI